MNVVMQKLDAPSCRIATGILAHSSHLHINIAVKVEKKEKKDRDADK